MTLRYRLKLIQAEPVSTAKTKTCYTTVYRVDDLERALRLLSERATGPRDTTHELTISEFADEIGISSNAVQKKLYKTKAQPVGSIWVNVRRPSFTYTRRDLETATQPQQRGRPKGML